MQFPSLPDQAQTIVPTLNPTLLSPQALALLAAIIVVLVGVVVALFRPRPFPPASRRLLGPLAAHQAQVTVYLRSLFTTTGEYFSRAPENLRDPAADPTVHKWTNIPDVHSASDVRAWLSVQRLLTASNPSVAVALDPGGSLRQSWGEHAVAIGPHYKALQILDSCEPRLVAYRNPSAFRCLVTQRVYESRPDSDFGVIYKGRHPATHRHGWVIMGLSDASTEATAGFLLQQARRLEQLMGRRCFAAIVAVSPAGRRPARLSSLQPPPAWWRRLLYRRVHQELLGELRGKG